MSTTQSIKPDTGRPPVPDAAMDCEQNGHSHGLPSVKLQQPGPGQSKRSLQATLSQSFQPDTPEHPQDSLLHSVSATSMRSTGSGIDPQTMNTQDASQPEESAFAMSAQRASTKQQLHQQSNPSAANGGANMLDDMLPEHSLAAQMSSEALASSLQQLSQPAANTQVEELADDMMPEHSLAAQMSNADQVLPLEEKAATDMLPEHSLVAQMSIDEPQPDAGEEDSVASGTRQLPHVLTTIESGLSAHFSGGFTPPGVSPFSMAPFPLSRAGSEALPPQAPSPESRKRHRGKVEEPLLRALSRLRVQRGPSQQLQQQHTASGSVSRVLSMYPGLERAISNWAQQAQHGQPQSAESASRALSQALYPGLERAVSNWAQHAQHDKLPSQQSAQLSSRAVSQALYPGLERAISNWAEQTQHESASRAASGISQCPGLECAISDWPQQTQHDKLNTSHTNQQGSRAMSSMSEAFYPGLERAISNWAQQAQHAMPDKMQVAESLTKAMSGVSDLPAGLECAISNWAQHAQHDRMEGAPSAARAMSGMSDLPPGLERAISNWAIQAQHAMPDMMQTGASPPRAMSGISEGCYPGLERAISNWAQHIELHKLNLSGSDQSASRASSAALFPGLEQAVSNWAQQAQHEVVSALQCPASVPDRSESDVADWPPGLERAISNWAQHAQHAAPSGTQTSGSASRATSLVSEGMYPGLERAISDWAQRAKHVNLQTPQPPQSASKVGSMMSDAYFPGLERAISNWAQHAQHVNPRCSEPAQTAIRAGSVMSEAFYPGLERAISNWAQHAQHVKPDLLPSSQPPPRAMSEAISEACYPGLERAISNWAQRAQQIQHELPQLAKSAASASRASSSALDEIYPGLEQAISDWARDAQFDLPAPMAQDLSSGLSSVSEEGSEEEGVTSAEPMEEDPQLLKLAATILSRSSSLYPGLEPSYVPPSSGPAGHPSSSQAPPPAQVIGKAILAAASMHGQASDMAGCPEDAAAQKIGEAVLTSAAVAATAAVKADHTAAGREAAAATRSPAPPASTAVRSPLIQVTTARADDKGDPQHEAGAVGSSQHSSPAGAKQAGRGAHADKVLKAHSRDLGQRQQLVHVKLHQGHPPTKSTEAASGKSFMDLKAEPAVADTHGFAKQAGAGSPSGKGVQGGLREAVSPTRDRMAQALR
ncbi:TPA: hypothetical protein ACH3X2_006161 [Trebouxia sp. C0005]